MKKLLLISTVLLLAACSKNVDPFANEKCEMASQVRIAELKTDQLTKFAQVKKTEHLLCESPLLFWKPACPKTPASADVSYDTKLMWQFSLANLAIYIVLGLLLCFSARPILAINELLRTAAQRLQKKQTSALQNELDAIRSSIDHARGLLRDLTAETDKQKDILASIVVSQDEAQDHRLELAEIKKQATSALESIKRSESAAQASAIFDDM